MDFRKRSASVLLGVMALGLSASMMVSATNETEKVKDQTVQVANAEKKDPSADNNLSPDENKGENGQGLLFLNGDNDKKVEGAGASENVNSGDGLIFLGNKNTENGGAPENEGSLSTGAKVRIGAAAVGVPGSIAGGYYLYDKLEGSASAEETQQQEQGGIENQEINNVDPVVPPTEVPNDNPIVSPELTKLVSKSGLDLKTILIIVVAVVIIVATAIISYLVYRARKSKAMKSNLLTTKEENINQYEIGAEKIDNDGNNIENENYTNNNIINENNNNVKKISLNDLLKLGIDIEYYKNVSENLVDAINDGSLKVAVGIACNIYGGVFDKIKNGVDNDGNQLVGDLRAFADSLVEYMGKFKEKMREIFKVESFHDELPEWEEAFGGESKFSKLCADVGYYKDSFNTDIQNVNNVDNNVFANANEDGQLFGNDMGLEGAFKIGGVNKKHYGGNLLDNPLINGKIGYNNMSYNQA